MIYLDREVFELRALDLSIALFTSELQKNPNVVYEFQPVEGRMWKSRQMLFDAGFAWKVNKPTSCSLCGCDVIKCESVVNGSTTFACGVSHNFASGGLYVQCVPRNHAEVPSE